VHPFLDRKSSNRPDHFCPRKRDVGASEKLVDGRMATAYLHNPNASADVVMFYSDLDRFFDDLEQRTGNPQSVFWVHACQTQRKFIVTDRAKTSPELAPSRIREPICDSASSQPRCPYTSLSFLK